MARLIVWNVMSLDGYFEGRSPWDLAFHGTIYGEELEALAREQLACHGSAGVRAKDL